MSILNDRQRHVIKDGKSLMPLNVQKVNKYIIFYLEHGGNQFQLTYPLKNKPERYWLLWRQGAQKELYEGRPYDTLEDLKRCAPFLEICFREVARFIKNRQLPIDKHAFLID